MSVKLHVSAPDDNKVVSLRFELTGWPRVVPGIVAEDAVEEQHTVKLPRKMRVYAGTVFIATDRGDVGEYALEVGSTNGPAMYAESRHKEAPVNYDGWTVPRYVAMNGVVTDEVTIWIVARTSGANDILRPGQPWSSRPHFGLQMWAVDDVPPPAPPPPAKVPTDYIPWAKRETWAARLEAAYTIWRGERDLSYLLFNGNDYLGGGPKEKCPLTPDELGEVINVMAAVNQRGEQLAYRIRNEKHRTFADRCQVRKDVARSMEADLAEQTSIYNQIRNYFPFGNGWDSIQGWLQFIER